VAVIDTEQIAGNGPCAGTVSKEVMSGGKGATVSGATRVCQRMDKDRTELEVNYGKANAKT
jgi:hypothetical protein